MSLGGTRLLALCLVLVYWLANALLHLQFSTWVTRAWQTPFGAVVPVEYTRQIAASCLLVVLAWVCLRSRRGQARWLTGFCWASLLLAIFLSNRWLLTTLVETIHYLQYALIAGLFAWVLDPRRQHWPLLEVLLLVFWLSVLDEAFQYLYLTARQGTYFDFNDLWLNHLGALAGLLCFYGFSARPPGAKGLPWLRRSLLGLCGVAAVLLAVLTQSGAVVLNPGRVIPPGGMHPDDSATTVYLQREPRLYGHWQRSFSGGHYFVLSPWQGLGLIILTSLPLARGRATWPSRAPTTVGGPP